MISLMAWFKMGKAAAVCKNGYVAKLSSAVISILVLPIMLPVSMPASTRCTVTPAFSLSF